MRGAHILFALLTALSVGACMRSTPQRTYILDPQTGQPIPVVTQPQYAQPQYAQPRYAQPQQQYAQPDARSLYSTSPAAVQQSYTEPQYAQPAPAQKRAGGGRGLFTSGRRNAAQAQPQQPGLLPPAVVQYNAPRVAAARGHPQGGPYVEPSGYAANAYAPAYTLDSGDKLRVVVFGQDGISNSYTVDAGGNVNLPLIGTVPARGYSTQQLSKIIADRLKQGYVREPHVSVDVEAYRPFFILGEVTNPGQYPYVANMTAETAVAIAGGFAPRANKSKLELTRNSSQQQFHGEVPLNYPLSPGDTVVVKERWF